MRTAMLLIVISTFAMLGCELSPIPVDVATGPQIPASLSGAALISRSVTAGPAAGISPVQYATVPADAFYDEYSNFYVVPQIAINYNDPLGLFTSDLEQVADGAYTELDGTDGFTRRYTVPWEPAVVFNTNDDFSRWERVEIGAGFSQLRVEQHDGYARGSLFQSEGQGGRAYLEVVKTDIYTYIKYFRLRSPDGDILEGYNPDNTTGFVYFDLFAGISNNDTLERTIGVKRFDSADLAGTRAGDFDYVGDGDLDARMVAVFDNQLLMIRPDVLVPPLEMSVNSGEDPRFSPDFVDWPSSQSETFEASEFADVSFVETLYGLGATPEFVAKSVVNPDYSVEYHENYVDWEPADVGLE